jgi:hypothetical protein
MDKKTLTQAGVVVGGLIFLVVYNMKSLGLYQSAIPQPAAVVPAVDTALVSAIESSPLGESIALLRNRMIDSAIEIEAADGSAAAPRQRYAAFNLRDPFESLLPQSVPVVSSSTYPQDGFSGSASVPDSVQGPTPTLPANVVVQGLLLGGENPLAIINRGVYGVGDTVSGAVIVGIDHSGVAFEHQGITTILMPQKDNARR